MVCCVNNCNKRWNTLLTCFTTNKSTKLCVVIMFGLNHVLTICIESMESNVLFRTPDHFENCGHNTYVNYSLNESEIVKSNRNRNSQAQHIISMLIFFSLFFPCLKYANNSNILCNLFFKNKIAEHLFTYYNWIKWWWWHLRISRTLHESIFKSLFGDSKTGRTICSC